MVGEEFDRIVKDEREDVVVFAYAPWCTISKPLHDVWAQLAKEFNSLKFVKINGQHN